MLVYDYNKTMFVGGKKKITTYQFNKIWSLNSETYIRKTTDMLPDALNK